MIHLAELEHGRANGGTSGRPGWWWEMTEELRVSYEVKELLQDIGVKIDKLTDALATKAAVADIAALGVRLDLQDGRLEKLETWRWKITGALSLVALFIGFTANILVRHL